MERIHGALLIARYPLARPQYREERALPEHRRILAAVMAGDADEARRAMSAHFDTIAGYLRAGTPARPTTASASPAGTSGGRRRLTRLSDWVIESLGWLTRERTVSTGRRVLITWPDYDVEDEHLGGALTSAGLRIRLAPKRGARTAAELRALLRGAAAAIVSTDPFDADAFGAHPGLRVIARVGVGVDSIDLDAATVGRRRGHDHARRERPDRRRPCASR